MPASWAEDASHCFPVFTFRILFPFLERYLLVSWLGLPFPSDLSFSFAPFSLSTHSSSSVPKQKPNSNQVIHSVPLSRHKLRTQYTAVPAPRQTPVAASHCKPVKVSHCTPVIAPEPFEPTPVNESCKPMPKTWQEATPMNKPEAMPVASQELAPTRVSTTDICTFTQCRAPVPTAVPKAPPGAFYLCVQASAAKVTRCCS